MFIAFVDNFSMLPTVGPYAQHLGGNAIAMGVAVAAYSVTNLLFNVVGGILLDRSGRRRLLLLGLMAASVSMALYATAQTLNSLMLIRLLHGAAGGILVPAVFTMIADVAPMEGRGKAMGRAGALIGAAAIVAPAVAGLLRQMSGFQSVFYMGSVLLALGLVIALLRIPETTAGESMPAQDRALAGSDEQSRRAGRAGFNVSELAIPGASGALWAGIWGIFVLMFAMGTLTAFLPDIVESLGHGAGLSGLMFTAFGLVAALIMMSPLSQIVDRQGLLIPVAVGLALIGVSLALLSLADGIALVMTACVLFGAGYGLVFPATSGQVAAASRPDRRGRAYGIFYAIFSLGVIAGAPLGGVFISRIPVVGSPFFPALIMSFVGVGVTFVLVGRTRTSSDGVDDGGVIIPR